MKKIEFFWEGVPPNATHQGRRQNKRGGHTTEAGKIALATWRAIVEKNAPEAPFCGPVRLVISLTWPHTKESAKIKNGLPVPKTTLPDGDNLLKFIKDTMTKCGYWKNDARVYSELIERWYGEISGAFFKVEEES